MKTINKNTEKKQRVRVLETGQLGTVTDQQLMKRDGVLHRYMQVLLDKQPHLDRWFWDDQVGGTRETCRVTIEHESGQTMICDLTRDFEKNEEVTMVKSGRIPSGKWKLVGLLHLDAVCCLLDGLRAREVAAM